MFTRGWQWARLVYGLDMLAEEPQLYGLLEGDGNPLDYVGYRFYDRRIRSVMNDPRARILTDNKWVFYRLASSLGLPVPDTYALYDPEFGVTASGEPCRSPDDLLRLLDRMRPEGVVIKPAGGIKGKNVRILDFIDYDTHKAKLRTGEIVDVVEQIDELPQVVMRSGSRGFVVQAVVQQHPFFAELNPSTANTVRVVTQLGKDGEVEIPFAAVRVGRAGSMTDNWAQGGVSVGVDPVTGRMTTGVLKPRHGGHVVDAHPDTGSPLTGQVVPMWPDVTALSRRAAHVVPGVRSIGWDILVAPDGPVILEANEAWSVVMVQVHTDGWLAQPGSSDALRANGVRPPERIPPAPVILWRMVARSASALARRWNRVRLPNDTGRPPSVGSPTS